MKKVGHEISVIFTDYKNSFLTKRVLVLFLLLFVVTHIFTAPLRQLSAGVGYKISAWSFPFLFFDMYYLLIFMFACIYFFSNVPFLNYHQIYRIVRTGKLRWGIHQIFNIIISAVLLMGAVFLMTELVLFPHASWENDWGKVIYTLSLTDIGEKYNVLLYFSYDIIKTYTPFQLVGKTLLIGILSISFLGNMMFMLSIYFSRTAALFAASLETAFIIMSENMYLFPQMVFFSPLSWIRLDKMLYLFQKNLPAPDISEMVLYLAGANLICIVLTLIKIRSIEYSKYIKTV